MTKTDREQRDILRFKKYIMEQEDGCHYWIGGINAGGYGKFWVNNRTVGAHRYAYEQLVGPIPNGFEVDHMCHNQAFGAGLCFGGNDCLHRRCVNPMHLEARSPRDNVLSGNTITAINSKKTHCPRGHELSGDNVSIVNGRRICRECRRLREREDYQDKPYKYVTKSRNRWKANVGIPGTHRLYYIGSFSTAEEAAMAVDDCLMILYGSAAKLNFPSRIAGAGEPLV